MALLFGAHRVGAEGDQRVGVRAARLAENPHWQRGAGPQPVALSPARRSARGRDYRTRELRVGWLARMRIRRLLTPDLVLGLARPPWQPVEGPPPSPGARIRPESQGAEPPLYLCPARFRGPRSDWEVQLRWAPIAGIGPTARGWQNRMPLVLHPYPHGFAATATDGPYLVSRRSPRRARGDRLLVSSDTTSAGSRTGFRAGSHTSEGRMANYGRWRAHQGKTLPAPPEY